MQFHKNLLIVFVSVIFGKKMLIANQLPFCHLACIWDPPFCCQLACAQEIQMNFNMN